MSCKTRSHVLSLWGQVSAGSVSEDLGPCMVVQSRAGVQVDISYR